MSTTPTVTIEIRNYDRLANALRLLTAGGEQLTDQVVEEKLIRDEPERMRAEPYPPMLPGQRYRRTHILANSWTHEKVNTGHWEIINWATQDGREYAEYVIGEPDDQADIHRGRWWTGRAKVEKHIEQLGSVLAASLAARYDAELQRAMG